MADQIRICHASLSLQTGGLERLLVEMGRFHDARRFALSFISMSGELGPPAEELRAMGFRVHALQATGRLSRMREIGAIFRRERIDILHTHSDYPHLYATPAARRNGVRGIVHTRHGQARQPTPWARWLWRNLARKVDRLVTISHDVERLTVERDGIPAEAVSCIWNGIDVERFDYRGPGEAPLAITVGRLCWEKDLGTLLQALRQAAGEVPHLRLRIVGDGSERQALERQARELGLVDRVDFMGFRDNVPELLAQAGFYVCSSVSEGLSLALAEAMAIGLPLIVTNVGGNAEIVADGRTGLVVPPRNVDALAAAMVRLATQPQHRRSLGLEGRRRIEEHFTIRGMMSRYEALYRDILEGHP